MEAAEELALDRLYHWESTSPAAIAMTQPLAGGQVLDFTWRQVADEARRVAAHLQSHGWEPGSKVGIISKNCAWWMMSDLAIWMAGYVSVPLYPVQAAETIRQILTHSEARGLFVGKLDGWAAMKPGVPDGLPCISFPVSPDDARAQYPGWDSIVQARAPLPGRPRRQAGELATLVYTSGTTGVPKGVMHSFGNMAFICRAALARAAVGPRDRVLSHLPLAHVAERIIIECAWLWAGVRVFFAESLETFSADMQRARPTLFFTVPRLWQKFQQAVHEKLPPARLKRLLGLPIIGTLVRRKVLKAMGLDQCRLAAGGAAPMPQPLLAWYASLGLRIIEGLGMTENFLSHSTLPGKLWHGSVGLPYDGVEHRIDPLSGELQLRSPANMLGYYKEPELTKQAFTEDGWLRTGDKGRIDEQGRLILTGRLKDLFKTSKGKYVAPAPIEHQLGDHPGIEVCLVTGASLPQPLGLAMLSPAGLGTAPELLARQLTEHLSGINARLDPHERLDCLVLLKTPWTTDNDFITPTMKVKRNRIEAAYGDRYAAWATQGSPVVWGE